VDNCTALHPYRRLLESFNSPHLHSGNWDRRDCVAAVTPLPADCGNRYGPIFTKHYRTGSTWLRRYFYQLLAADVGQEPLGQVCGELCAGRSRCRHRQLARRQNCFCGQGRGHYWMAATTSNRGLTANSFPRCPLTQRWFCGASITRRPPYLNFWHQGISRFMCCMSINQTGRTASPPSGEQV
jgi:hypothetical protein